MNESENCGGLSGIPAEMQSCPAETGYESLPMADKLHLMFRAVLYHLQHSDDSFGGQKNVLSILARRGSMTQKALLDYSRVRAGSLSELLGKLEAAGLIERRPNCDDRRVQDVALTEKGIEVEAACRVRRKESRSRMFDPLTPEEQEQLLHLLEKLNGNW